MLQPSAPSTATPRAFGRGPDNSCTLSAHGAAPETAWVRDLPPRATAAPLARAPAECFAHRATAKKVDHAAAQVLWPGAAPVSLLFLCRIVK